MILIFVQKIHQIDNYSFAIHWMDQTVDQFLLSDLQKHCPCIQCCEKENVVQKEVRARQITSVGSYALRIEFTSGCSRGIFTFHFLRKWARKGETIRSTTSCAPIEAYES